MKTLYFFDRCFWCLEDFFSYIDGVVETEVGYANGHTKNPTYEQVGSGTTGYEEVCKVVFNEAILPIDTLVFQFFQKLNPRKIYTLEESADHENQSAIYYSLEKDKDTILKVKQEIEETYKNPLLTVVEPLTSYYTAEEEHQHYFKKHPEEAICKI